MNFFSFFTIDSNILTVVVFLIGAVLLIRAESPTRAGSAIGRAGVTAYMATTGIVYNVLLRGIELPQGSTLAWSNEVLHVVAPDPGGARLALRPGPQPTRVEAHLDHRDLPDRVGASTR